MTELTKEDVQNVMRDVLTERDTIASESHSADHEFIKVLQAREQRKIVRVERFKLSFIGAFATLIVGSLVWLGRLVIEAMPRVGN